AVQRPVVLRDCRYIWHAPPLSLKTGDLSGALRSPETRLASLAVEQRPDVAQQLVGAVRAIAVVGDEAADDLIRALELLWVRRLGRGRDLHHVAQVGEELLLNRLLEPLVTGIIEGLAASRQGRDADQNLLTERLLGVLGDADLL